MTRFGMARLPRAQPFVRIIITGLLMFCLAILETFSGCRRAEREPARNIPGPAPAQREATELNVRAEPAQRPDDIVVRSSTHLPPNVDEVDVIPSPFLESMEVVNVTYGPPVAPRTVPLLITPMPEASPVLGPGIESLITPKAPLKAPEVIPSDSPFAEDEDPRP
ncbi:MAG: hypothetical protein ABIK09_08165 [Pseudomonadota bacterium]